jgi:xylosylprotein 4-beta-galactosyltransferase
MSFKALRSLAAVLLLICVVAVYIIYSNVDETNLRKVHKWAKRKGHYLCVLIPYRDRWDEVQILVPELHQFLHNQSVDHSFLILNQTDRFRFNRASLINVGWFEADRLGCDYFVMHDVDIVPLNPELNYRYPGKDRIRHISAGRYHPIARYDYPKFIGGVLMLTMENYKQVDGMSNKYWGWGLEDDEFYLRLQEANLTQNIDRPTNLTTDRLTTFKHIHDRRKRKRDYAMIGNQKQMSRRRDRISGLHSVKYVVASRSFLNLDGVRANVLNIELECDTSWTPYCLMPSSNAR